MHLNRQRPELRDEAFHLVDDALDTGVKKDGKSHALSFDDEGMFLWMEAYPMVTKGIEE